MDTPWSLFHALTRTQIDELSQTQIRAFLKTVAPDQIDKWLVWTAGWEGWKPALQCSDLVDTSKYQAFASTEGNQPERRLGARLQKRFQVLIEAQGTIFKANTVDISVSGIRLDRPMPKTLLGTFSLNLVKESDRSIIEMICRLSDPANSLDRLRIIKVAKLELFYSWLQE